MRLFFKTMLLASALSTLQACSADNPMNMDTAIPVTMVATHAFDTDTQITSVAFVPNNVAPWLGRLILLDDAGHLFSTDIEGRTAIALAPKKYLDIFGLSLDNAAGVFLAINNNNDLEAFLESDDKGNFTPMAYSGQPLKVSAFCMSATPSSGGTRVLTADGEIVELMISINQNVAEQTLGKTHKNDKTRGACHTNTDANPKIWLQTIRRSTPEAFNPLAKTTNPVKTLTGTFGPTRFMSALDGKLVSEDIQNPDILYTIIVGNGLSIKGIEKVNSLTATTANYGGAAFADGLIAMIDNNEQRIVFLSREYVERKITEAALTP